MKSLRSLLLLPFLMVLGLVGLALVVAPGSATASPCQVVQVDKPGPGGAAVVQVRWSRKQQNSLASLPRCWRNRSKPNPVGIRPRSLLQERAG